ncbi:MULTISPECIES: hypothetical protein [unclassified Lactococcus]|uniref:hypothetical protein n=1 Tax=unclassified Lactococcus TaxID=2643510 RepID=UPI0011C7E306|nr:MULTISPECIES: hypothetical protein [unclassified Lactococcus]MQW22959.1 hypothetical protein [Lactococcus sp. dk101]TXK44496.1 hypothetical protein FVP42_04380 [Lactococcus sp. dk310]TXK50349.1 hypothetical protein FVP43_04350 [Lactococcus sp. dk322]
MIETIEEEFEFIDQCRKQISRIYQFLSDSSNKVNIKYKIKLKYRLFKLKHWIRQSERSINKIAKAHGNDYLDNGKVVHQ